MDRFDIVIRGGEVWAPAGITRADIAIRRGSVAALSTSEFDLTASNVIDARGKIVIPGLIDTHTHHRDPGFTQPRQSGHCYLGSGRRCCHA